MENNNSIRCLARIHSTYKVVITYRPGGLFWVLQFWELWIYLAQAFSLDWTTT